MGIGGERTGGACGFQQLDHPLVRAVVPDCDVGCIAHDICQRNGQGEVQPFAHDARAKQRLAGLEVVQVGKTERVRDLVQVSPGNRFREQRERIGAVGACRCAQRFEGRPHVEHHPISGAGGIEHRIQQELLLGPRVLRVGIIAEQRFEDGVPPAVPRVVGLRRLEVETGEAEAVARADRCRTGKAGDVLFHLAVEFVGVFCGFLGVLLRGGKVGGELVPGGHSLAAAYAALVLQVRRHLLEAGEHAFDAGDLLLERVDVAPEGAIAMVRRRCVQRRYGIVQRVGLIAAQFGVEQGLAHIELDVADVLQQRRDRLAGTGLAVFQSGDRIAPLLLETAGTADKLADLAGGIADAREAALKRFAGRAVFIGTRRLVEAGGRLADVGFRLAGIHEPAVHLMEVACRGLQSTDQAPGHAGCGAAELGGRATDALQGAADAVREAGGVHVAGGEVAAGFGLAVEKPDFEDLADEPGAGEQATAAAVSLSVDVRRLDRLDPLRDFLGVDLQGLAVADRDLEDVVAFAGGGLHRGREAGQAGADAIRRFLQGLRDALQDVAFARLEAGAQSRLQQPAYSKQAAAGLLVRGKRLGELRLDLAVGGLGPAVVVVGDRVEIGAAGGDGVLDAGGDAGDAGLHAGQGRLDRVRHPTHQRGLARAGSEHGVAALHRREEAGFERAKRIAQRRTEAAQGSPRFRRLVRRRRRRLEQGADLAADAGHRLLNLGKGVRQGTDDILHVLADLPGRCRIETLQRGLDRAEARRAARRLRRVDAAEDIGKHGEHGRADAVALRHRRRTQQAALLEALPQGAAVGLQLVQGRPEQIAGLDRGRLLQREAVEIAVAHVDEGIQLRCGAIENRAQRDHAVAHYLADHIEGLAVTAGGIEEERGARTDSGELALHFQRQIDCRAEFGAERRARFHCRGEAPVACHIEAAGKVLEPLHVVLELVQLGRRRTDLLVDPVASLRGLLLLLGRRCRHVVGGRALPLERIGHVALAGRDLDGAACAAERIGEEGFDPRLHLRRDVVPLALSEVGEKLGERDFDAGAAILAGQRLFLRLQGGELLHHRLLQLVRVEADHLLGRRFRLDLDPADVEGIPEEAELRGIEQARLDPDRGAAEAGRREGDVDKVPGICHRQPVVLGHAAHDVEAGPV